VRGTLSFLLPPHSPLGTERIQLNLATQDKRSHIPSSHKPCCRSSKSARCTHAVQPTQHPNIRNSGALLLVIIQRATSACRVGFIWQYLSFAYKALEASAICTIFALSINWPCPDRRNPVLSRKRDRGTVAGINPGLQNLLNCAHLSQAM
jgi:hypothetical protein